MELYAKGQLSFLILTCLLERDYYGLDFISEIDKKSNGRILLKKPSVYSNLTRMEKQGYVSSYLKSSDFGPNRKYYSVTEKGRNFYQDLKSYFDRNGIDVFRDFQENDNGDSVHTIISQSSEQKKSFSQSFTIPPTVADEKINTNTNENSVDVNEVSDDDEYFDFSALNDNPKEGAEKQIIDQNSPIKDNASEMEKDVIATENTSNDSGSSQERNTYSIRSLLANKDSNAVNEERSQDSVEKTVITSQDTSIPSQEKDDGVFLSDKERDEYNRRLYDISKDINKYKRKRSFAEDQIAFTVDSPLQQSQEKTRANIEDFKSSLLENKGKYGENQDTQNVNFLQQMRERFNRGNHGSYSENSKAITNKDSGKETAHQDDGHFITARLESSQVERAKKIEPPRLRIVEQSRENSYKMPPPKRDVSIDPSHKEILSKLYSKSSETTGEVREDMLYDYSDLQSFYKDQNIAFNEYKKPTQKLEHNTNKLYLYVSLITFFAACLVSAMVYVCLLSSDKVYPGTSFLYILLPALLLIDVGIKFYNYKKYLAWMPKPILPQWKIWCITLLTCGIIIGINFIAGLSPATYADFATTLYLPIVLTFVVLPVRYYMKRLLIIKFWK